MTHQELKIELIKAFDEQIFEIIVENSDGLSGLNKIKNLYSYNDLFNLTEKLSSTETKKLLSNISESLGEDVVILKSIKQVKDYSMSLLDKMNIALQNKDKIAQKHFIGNEDTIIKTFLLKAKQNVSLDRLKSSGNEVTFEKVRSLSETRWNKAFTQNLNDSKSFSFAKFEQNILIDPIISTLNLI